MSYQHVWTTHIDNNVVELVSTHLTHLTKLVHFISALWLLDLSEKEIRNNYWSQCQQQWLSMFDALVMKLPWLKKLLIFSHYYSINSISTVETTSSMDTRHFMLEMSFFLKCLSDSNLPPSQRTKYPNYIHQGNHISTVILLLFWFPLNTFNTTQYALP